jgi:exopolysaccharide biosynthesis polyprenyl glycosylphosphotransferase
MGLLLPSPFAGDHPQKEWALLLADHTLILASWIGVAAVAAAGEARFFGGTATGLLTEKSFLLGTVREGVLFAVIATLLAYSEGVYEQARRVKTATLAKSLTWATVLLTGIGLSGFWTPSLSRSAFSVGLSLASLLLWRRWRQHVCAKRLRQGLARNVLILGAGARGREVASYLEHHSELGRIVRGFLDDEHRAFGVLGPPEKLAAIARAEFVDEVILAEPHRHDLAELAIREGRRNHLDVKVVPDLYGCELNKTCIENLGAISLFNLHQETVPAARLILKRALDIVCSSCLLMLTAPLLLVIAALIKFDSPGPAIYCALRVGRKGSRFRCHKFRTMVANANEVKDALRARNQREGPTFKIVEDPRITRVGRWLRRYSLDELPQLWNVWKGDMSMVGPRPHPLDDYARYRLEHLRRLDVTPGITGLWQVSARQSSSFQTNMALDLEYIERWSLWMDVRILLKTVAVVFQGTGA